MVMKLRSKCVSYDFDMGEDCTLDFNINIDFNGNTDKEITVNIEIIEEDLTYDQLAIVAQIIGETAYKLGCEKKS